MTNSKTKIFTSFANLLRYLIDINGFTNREFAEKIGKTESQISHWLSGSHSPQRKTIASIANNCDVNIYEHHDQWLLEMGNTYSGHSFHNVAQERVNYVAEPTRFYDAIDALPPLESGAYSRADALKLLELAESLLRSAREALKRLDDDS